MSELQEYPLVTFALFAYNQERFIREAVEAALSQKYARLEIILSDDCSVDSTFEIISSIASDYSGPHEIIVNRNPVNLGLAKHFSNIVKIARGDIIVVAAGDDISLPTRVSKTVEMLSSAPDAYFASFTDTVIDADGVLRSRRSNEDENKVSKVTLEDYISGCNHPLSGASRGYRKKMFEVFGDLHTECPTEDTPSILRGLMIGHALVSSACGILYRQHGTNLSGPESLHSMKFEEIRNQYLRDVRFAQTAGLITIEKKEQIERWAEKNYRRRLIAKEFYYAPIKAIYFCQKIMPSNDFRLREKLEMLRRVIR
ncbi:MAG: glycosyltransferase [Pseudomonadota bacterium]